MKSHSELGYDMFASQGSDYLNDHVPVFVIDSWYMKCLHFSCLYISTRNMVKAISNFGGVDVENWFPSYFVVKNLFFRSTWSVWFKAIKAWT